MVQLPLLKQGHDLSGKPVPLLHHPHSKTVFLHLQMEPPLFLPLHLVQSLGTTKKSLGPSSSHPQAGSSWVLIFSVMETPERLWETSSCTVFDQSQSRDFFLHLRGLFYISFSVHCFLSCPWVLLRRAWLCFLYSLPAGICTH